MTKYIQWVSNATPAMSAEHFHEHNL